MAANWQDQTLQFKFLLIQAVLLASVAGALLVGLADAQLQPLQAQAAPR